MRLIRCNYDGFSGPNAGRFWCRWLFFWLEQLPQCRAEVGFMDELQCFFRRSILDKNLQHAS